jgi:short-subunit dehydrogenase
MLARERLLADAVTVGLLSSLSHYASYPGAAVYAASKDGVAHYARSLAVARPLAHTLTVFPGPTRTAHARRYSPDNSREAKRMPPEQVAGAMVRGVRNGRWRIIPGMGNQVLAVAGHLFPRLLEWSMKKAILEKLEETKRMGDKEMGR